MDNRYISLLARLCIGINAENNIIDSEVLYEFYNLYSIIGNINLVDMIKTYASNIGISLNHDGLLSWRHRNIQLLYIYHSIIYIAKVQRMYNIKGECISIAYFAYKEIRKSDPKVRFCYGYLFHPTYYTYIPYAWINLSGKIIDVCHLNVNGYSFACQMDLVYIENDLKQIEIIDVNIEAFRLNCINIDAYFNYRLSEPTLRSFDIVYTKLMRKMLEKRTSWICVLPNI
jgi:hypothetical protein